LSALLADVPNGTPVEIWLQDEARIGQKNGVVRQWAKRGSRPRQPVDQRYENAYLFGAICPARGTAAALALPQADTEAMQLHLNEISRHVAEGAQARAGWHTTGSLDMPKNITPIFLPSRARTEPGREHLAVHAGQLAIKPRLRNLRRNHRRGLRGMAKSRRSTQDNHFNRDARLGARRSIPMTVGIR
jgi:hypothetical protein